MKAKRSVGEQVWVPRDGTKGAKLEGQRFQKGRESLEQKGAKLG